MPEQTLNVVYAIRHRFDRSFEYRYVGLTSRGQFRFIEHLKAAKQTSHREYNSDKYVWIREKMFQVEFDILETCDSVEDLDFAERKWIHILIERGHRLLNKTSGGQFFVMSEETKRKIGEASRGRLHTDEARLKISQWHRENARYGEDHPRYGIQVSEETRRKQSSLKTGENHWAFGLRGEDHYNYGRVLTEDHKKKISKALSGRTVSEDVRRRASERMMGHVKSPETRRKHSEALKGKPNKGAHSRWHTSRISSTQNVSSVSEKLNETLT
jgi:hypothetical protein